MASYYAPLIFNAVIFMAFLTFYFNNNIKGKAALNSAWMSLKKTAPALLLIMIVMIFLERIFNAKMMADHISQTSGPVGYLVAAALGALISVPPFIAFPLGGQLLAAGVNVGFIAVLLTSLVMVHTLSIPLEVKELGLKFALIRNSASFILAIIVGILISMLY
jgi:uncharacterized membrane protein YraQ (UPF0718 family)